MSLKKLLIKQIEMRKGELWSYNEMCEFCRIWGYRTSNGERRLREERELVETVCNHKRIILGYRKKQKQKQEQKSLF